MPDVTRVNAMIPRNLKRLAFIELARREEKFTHWLQQQLELGVILLLQGIQTACQVFMRREDLPETDKSTHNFNIHLDGPFTPEHTGEHGDTLLGKGIGWCPASTPGS